MNPEEANGGHNQSSLSFPVKFVGNLSNFEVYEYLKEMKDTTANRDRKNAPKANRQLSTLVYEALQYFKETPTQDQTAPGIQEFLRRIQPYNLTKHEKLTIVNTVRAHFKIKECPSGAVDIEAIVEESEERLSEEQTQEILEIVKETLTPPQETEEMDQSDG